MNVYCGNPILTVGIDTRKIAAGGNDLVLWRLDPPRYCWCLVACARAGPESPLPTLNTAVDKGRVRRSKKPVHHGLHTQKYTFPLQGRGAFEAGSSEILSMPSSMRSGWAGVAITHPQHSC